jgi:ATP-dependent Clp protease protease subunit
MIHSIGHGYSGKIDDTRISHQESEFLQSYLTDILVKNTGQKISKVKKDIERDKFMSSSEALAYGIIDEII